MTKRMYYTCPIKALYMQEEFGVQFEDFDEDGYDFMDLIDKACESELVSGQIYVAKESEFLFKIKEGDLIKENDGEVTGFVCSLSPYEDRFAISIDDEGGTDMFTSSHVKIIMRDNEHFFNPEIESND